MGLPGRSLELRGDAHPRGMTAHDRTRLTGRLFFSAARELTASKGRRPRALAARAGEGRWRREREDQEKHQEKNKESIWCRANGCQALAYASVTGTRMRKISA